MNAYTNTRGALLPLRSAVINNQEIQGSDDCSFIPFGGDSPTPAADLSRLHAQLLPDSPLTLLGQRFMKRFYYTLLTRDHEIFGVVAYVDALPVGFIVATAFSDTFMTMALRRHWVYLAWTLFVTILRAPRALSSIWEAWKIMRFRKTDSRDDASGEILSMGVLPPYRNSSFGRRTGIDIAGTLVRNILNDLRILNTTGVRVIVDADNFNAQNFYRAHGWRLVYDHVPGWRVPCMELFHRQRNPLLISPAIHYGTCFTINDIYSICGFQGGAP